MAAVGDGDDGVGLLGGVEQAAAEAHKGWMR
jgi:hypothetical protein